MKRREFLKNAVIAVSGAAIPLSALELIDPGKLLAAQPELRWIFLVDTYKCVGCGHCVKACKEENEIPYEANVSRTWVERYVITRDGKLHADSPKAARDGFTTSRIHVGQGKLTTPRLDIDHGKLETMKTMTEAEKYIDVKEEEIAQAFFVPKLCNQCDNPPCVQVCPVGATYKTADGVVLVDRKWCIGCGYCIMGCPYGVRFFHPEYNVAEKCNFCYHRIHQGMKSACVTACPFGARQIGNLRDPNDPVTKSVLTQRVGVLKDEFGTKPQVFYIGLNQEVR
jgi:Fe-S-cluster-containing dehydrogenase component